MPRQKDLELKKLKSETLQHYGKIYYMLNTNNGNGMGYNLREAGRCGCASEETRKKMSESMKGKNILNGVSIGQMKKKIKSVRKISIMPDKDKTTLLPKYLKYVNWVSEEGYHVVSHPLCKQKKFVSTQKMVNLEEQKFRAVAFLESLNSQL